MEYKIRIKTLNSLEYEGQLIIGSEINEIMHIFLNKIDIESSP